MGESIVDYPEMENKKGNAPSSVAALEVSVSFGRFVNDSLSWEKWPSFSSNRYLEEVEKCSTPGSVAQKKAYFEARYKKIGALKAESFDQEKKTNSGTTRLDDENSSDLLRNNNGTEAEHDLVDSQKTFEVVEQEIHEMDSTLIEETTEDTTSTEECQSSSVEKGKEESDSRPFSPKSQKVREADLLKEGTYSVGSHGVTEHPQDLNTKIGNTSKLKAESASLDPPKVSLKKTLTTIGGNDAKVKKNPATPITKSPQVLSPRVSKSISSSTIMSASRSSTRKGNCSSTPRSNNSSAGENKKVIPTSLHMSLSLGSKNSPTWASLTTTRRSSIMEKMGDKEIVKRVFKSFQNSYNQQKTCGEERSTTKQVAPTKGAESRVSTSMHSRKKNERSLKESVMGQRSTKGSFGSRSDERAEKRKEFLKRLEEKSNAKEEERLCQQSKLKEEKEAEMKKLRQSLNFKALPMPDFYRAERSTKSGSDKGVKNETWS